MKYTSLKYKTPICCCCSVSKSCLTLCNSMDCSAPGFPVLHHLPEFVQTHALSRWCRPTISSSAAPFSCPQSLPVSGSFPMSWLFASGGQSTKTSASASVLPVNTHGLSWRRGERHLSCTLLHNLRLGKPPWGLASVNRQCIMGDRRNPTVSKKTDCVNFGIPQCSKAD